MVQNKPDPPKEEPNVNESSNIAVVAGTDSEDDELGYEGYTMLPTDANELDDPSEDEESVEIAPEIEISQVHPSTFEKSTADELRAVWNQERTENETINPDLAREVLKAMTGFNLPSTAIPPWAKEVGEDDWKNHLLEKIRREK